MTRTWPYPDLRNGTSLHLITDTHDTDGIDFVRGWLDRTALDVEALHVATTGGHIHTGDMTNSWFDGSDPALTQQKITDQFATYRAWRDGITAADGLPFVQAAGNHDLLGTYDGPSGPREGISGEQWAADVGIDGQNTAATMGQARVLAISPDEWIAVDGSVLENNDYRLSPATIAWLDSELSADSTPTFVACHVPLLAQYPDDPYTADAANPALREVIGSHPNLVGWLCGHRHNGINAAYDNADVITVAGREIFTVCGVGGGGGWVTGGNAYSGGRWGAQSFSTWLTLLDDTTADVRWRDHLSRSWARADHTTGHTLLTRTAG